MSWLSDRLGVHLNLRPLAAPAGGIIGGLLGGPAGAALGAGLFKAGDNLAHGDSVGHSLGQGALNAGIAGIGAGGLQALRGAFGGGAGAADAVTGAFTPGSEVGAGLSQDAITGGVSGAQGGGSSFLGNVAGGAKDVGSWIGSHPQAVGMGLQGVGQIAQSGSENALRREQARSLDLNNQSDQYAIDAKKKRDAALAPLLASFQGQAQQYANKPYQIAPNPYTTGMASSPYS